MKYLWMLLIPLVFSCEVDDPLDPDTPEDPRDFFTGSWNCIETQVKSTNIAYTVNIFTDPDDSTKILMENFAYVGFGEFVYGIVNGNNVTVPQQVPCEGWLVQGSGSRIEKDKIQWSYSVEAGGDVFDYTATFTRR